VIKEPILVEEDSNIGIGCEGHRKDTKDNIEDE